MSDRPSRRLRQLPFALSATLLIALAACSGQQPGAAKKAGSQAVEVVTAEAIMQPMGVEIEAVGTARANESVDVTSKTSNKVTAIRFEEGDRVRKGAILVELDGAEVRASLADAEALTRAREGSFLVAFEGRHRIWRYEPSPGTFESTPTPIAIPAKMSRAPRNGGLEGLTSLPDGRLLALTEEFANPDGSFKGWLIDSGRFAELAYLPPKGFHVADCAALQSGDVLVLERRYVSFGIFSARLTIVDGKTLQPGGKLSGRELLRIEQPLAVENFEGLTVQQTPKGTMIYLVSDDNYNPFQQTLLLQFLLPNKEH